MLRVYFKYDRKLLTKLCHCAKESLELFFGTVLGLDDGIPGVIMVIHTFGDYARFHPHLHAIVADGLFRPGGAFHCLPNTDPKQLEEIFRSKVPGMLKAEGKINDQVIEKLMAWRHSGFSVHIGNRIAADDRDGQRMLAEYIMRNAFSEQKITYIEDTGKVLYRSAMTHGGNKKNFEILTAEEFIATITQHIPDKSFQMARYYGWYSNRSRGERNKACPELVEGAALCGTGNQPSPDSPQATVLDVSDYKPRRIPSKTWRELIKKIWEVDPLSCPRCHHEMKIINLINQPEVIERILRHLGLWKQQTAPSGRKEKPPEHGPVVMEDFDDGWPGYEEPACAAEASSQASL
jgi:DTW domain-containing protein YfiP